ncbi:LrgB family protein [Clostridium sp. NSJ-6]|uniref:LrgB family protein n=1 Tax=Clostridium hominis TaxID=2763036 RepID=A0ABR7DHF8_9CLOT|nr:LrgB family protein [Clostridium hominis]MBC5630113.1 LrgB family protein [Clostridium hominis]MDU2670690.1 LrgB family protein [Clostridium sp.]
MNIIIENMFFGIVISLIAFELGKIIYNKTKLPIFNPLLTSIIIVIVILKIFNIDFELYNKGGQFINMFLGPATVILAVPLYKQLLLLKKNFVPIIIGISIGSVVSVISVILLSTVFNLDKEIIISLIPKSVTTPIGVEISNSLGGITGITVMAVILTGITGAIIAPTVCKIFKINNPVARGIGIGTASHAVGTSKALEIGETEGAMSSLAIGIAGLITVVVAPICLDILTKLL